MLRRILAWGLIGVVAALAGTALTARFHDGPLAVFPGGPLASGEWADPSWGDASFLTDVGEIELQLVDPPRSRVTWVLVHEGRAYVPCGVPQFRLWKQWPHQAERDGRAVVRVGGRRHARLALRMTDPALVTKLRAELGRKYGVGDRPETVWYFRLDPRPLDPGEEP